MGERGGVEAGVAQNVRERSGQSTPETASAAVQAATERRPCKPVVPGSIPGPSLDSATRWLWSAVHNAVAHPLLVVLPARYGTALHDWTAARAWPEATR